MKKIITAVFSGVFFCSTALVHAGVGAEINIAGKGYPTSFKMPAKVTPNDYLAKTIIFKVRPEYRSNCKAQSVDNILILQDFLNSIGAQNVAKIYPNHEAPATQRNALGQKLVDLSLMYSFKYTSEMPLEKVINKMLAMKLFEYVEPWYIHHTQAIYTPNDPSLGSQYHIKGNQAGSIDAYTAWNTQKGNASVVVGIIDTGTQPTHPDLAPNYLGGYDVAMNDSDPTWQGSNHGCAVSGDACAATDNGTGVASPGFGCKFKAIKIADASGALTAGYAGITWAADNGCKILNCSWGGSGGGTYGQDIVNYAAINKNCVIFASAGNSGIEESLWPSSYDNVYRVASSDAQDRRSSFSTYGLDVDISSPGSSIYSTVNGTGYGSMSGTSMASPVAAGAAAIVQAQYNYANAFQIGERLKQTCDPMANSSTQNTAALYAAGKLGKGRIDMARAVNASITAKSLVMSPINITDGNDNAFMPGENLSIDGTFINYLDATSASCAATLSVVSGPGTVTTGNYTIGTLATLGTTTNSGSPFVVNIQGSAGLNSKITFKLTITDGSYSSDQYFTVTVNVDYINIINNDLHTTITSKGRIGYNLDGTQEGLGIEYQIPSPNNMLYEMSLMIGTSTSKVSDMFRGSGGGDNDFQSVQRVYEVNPAIVSDFDVDGKFNDQGASSSIPVEVRHSAYAWSTTPYRKFVIVRYAIKNTGGTALSNLFAGIVADWDITNAAKNKGAYDATYKMGYCYDVSGANGLYAGIKLLTNTGGAQNYVLDLVTGGNGGIDAYQDFMTNEKYQALSTSRNNDGYAATGGDVMDCVSEGPLTIAAGDSVIVAFALIGGDNLADLQASACAAQDKWDNGCATIGVSEVENDHFWAISYPNPANNFINLEYTVIGYDDASLRVMNSLGEVVATYNNLAQGRNILNLDVTGLSSGTYFYQLKAGEQVLSKKFNVMK